MSVSLLLVHGINMVYGLELDNWRKSLFRLGLKKKKYLKSQIMRKIYKTIPLINNYNNRSRKYVFDDFSCVKFLFVG